MVLPENNVFRELAKEYNRIVIYREITGDMVTPVFLLNRFQDRNNLFLLESANLDKSFSRFTFFGMNPEEVITYENGISRIHFPHGSPEQTVENPIKYLAQQLEGVNSAVEDAFGRFCGGYVGFNGYDSANFMGNLRTPISEDKENISFGYMKISEFYVFDNHMGKLYGAVSVKVEGDLDVIYENAKKRTLEMAQELLDLPLGKDKEFYSGEPEGQYVDMREKEFQGVVEQLKHDIEMGECIQTVVSNKYSVQASINPVNFYRTLRNLNPSPYMFYFKFGDTVILGTSPEIHLKITDRKAILKPIAGTYKVDSDVEKQKERLLEDPKERAEHLMLLDLARNDLYAGCQHDSVEVVQSFTPEVYSHVIHIVSEVTGKLRDDIAPMDLFCKTFPAGTVSGAPKVRAMELIDSYEVSPRGFYAGCAGYFSYSQDVDTCIIIRSAMVKKDSVTFRAGAGIVYDSVPVKEYQEVENKLGALFQALANIPTLEKSNVFND